MKCLASEKLEAYSFVGDRRPGACGGSISKMTPFIQREFDMGQEWYIAQNGQRVGPISEAELRQQAAAGKIQPSDMIWKQGMDKWVPASKVKGLFPPAQTKTTPTSDQSSSNHAIPAAILEAVPVLPVDSLPGHGSSGSEPGHKPTSSSPSAKFPEASIGPNALSSASASNVVVQILYAGSGQRNSLSRYYEILFDKRQLADLHITEAANLRLETNTGGHTLEVQPYQKVKLPLLGEKRTNAARKQYVLQFPTEGCYTVTLQSKTGIMSPPEFLDQVEVNNTSTAPGMVQPANVQKATATPFPPKDSASQLPLLEPAGIMGRLSGYLTCKNCKTKVKTPPPEWGEYGICPGCKSQLKLPLRTKGEWLNLLRGTQREPYVRQLAEILHLNPDNPTIHQALDHVVNVLHPDPIGKGGIISFMQMKIICDQIRENSVERYGTSEGSDLIALVGKGLGREIVRANYNDPLVQTAGTPWKLFLWLVNEQFGGCHKNAHFEGSVGHSNSDVNSACFIAKNNETYPDDLCTKFSPTMLNNLLELALSHAKQVHQQQEMEAERAFQQQAAQQAAYQQAALFQQQQSIVPSSPSPPPAPSSSGPQVKERWCASCQGKGWQNMGTSSERRCPSCGGQGVVREPG